jgi:multidrug efflux pump subunit AcrA (membrane-fusion protein)
LLHGCTSNQATPSSPVTDARPTPDLRIRRGEFLKTFLLTGELEAVVGHPVVVPRNPVLNVTIRWILDDGSTVKEGEKVIELDTTQVIGDMAQKRIAAEAALSKLDRKGAEVVVHMEDKEYAVESARVAHEKARLRAAVPEDLISRREYQEAQLEAERTRVAHENAVADLEAFREASTREIEILRIQLEKARREITRAELALETMVLRAPRSGIFVVGVLPWEGRKIQVGDSVWTGLKIAEIPDLTEMRVRAKLSDVDDGKIAAGMRATCTVDAYPNSPVEGIVRDISPVAQEERRSPVRRWFEVVVELDRSDPVIMRPGMSVRVEVESVRRENVLLVPRAAVEHGAEAARVHLENGSAAAVTLGECNASVCELIEGPGEGARLSRVRG